MVDYNMKCLRRSVEGRKVVELPSLNVAEFWRGEALDIDVQPCSAFTADSQEMWVYIRQQVCWRTDRTIKARWYHYPKIKGGSFDPLKEGWCGFFEARREQVVYVYIRGLLEAPVLRTVGGGDTVGVFPHHASALGLVSPREPWGDKKAYKLS